MVKAATHFTTPQLISIPDTLKVSKPKVLTVLRTLPFLVFLEPNCKKKRWKNLKLLRLYEHYKGK